MMSLRNVLTSMVLAMFPVVLMAQNAASGKISRDTSQTGNVDVIVQYGRKPAADQHGTVSKVGGTLRRAPNSINGGAYTIPGSALETLAADPNFIHIAPDHGLRGILNFANPAVSANIALQHGITGTGIGVAVVDTGINQDPELNAQNGWGSRIVFIENFVPGQGWNIFDAGNRYGHGTHMAGVAAGDASQSDNSDNTYRFRGIAPNANIINLQVRCAVANPAAPLTPPRGSARS
jgi:serine protease AprX